MTLSFDVTVVQELVRACQTANDEFQKAQNLIQEVHSHNDWTCKEKDTIDDLMRQCKNMVKKLCEEQFSFLEAIKLVEGELSDAEKSISNLFDGVESILSRVLAIPVAETVVNGGGLLQNALGGFFENVAGTVNGVIDHVNAVNSAEFDNEGLLVWTDNANPPTIEYLEALGGEAYLKSKMGDVEVHWPNGKVQQFAADPFGIHALESEIREVCSPISIVAASSLEL